MITGFVNQIQNEYLELGQACLSAHMDYPDLGNKINLYLNKQNAFVFIYFCIARIFIADTK